MAISLGMDEVSGTVLLLFWLNIAWSTPSSVELCPTSSVHLTLPDTSAHVPAYVEDTRSTTLATT